MERLPRSVPRAVAGGAFASRPKTPPATAGGTDILDTTATTIWIDLDNSPHVPLFAPIIKHYRESGIDVLLTARDHSQTIELLNIHGLGGTFAVIGKHYGKSKINKVCGLIQRAGQLLSHVKKERGRGARITVAVSHGSRSMVLAAKRLGIPVITMYDYEHTETTIFNRFSDLVMMPERIPDTALDAIGLPVSKRVKYPGIKEELYVRNFHPIPNFGRQFLERIFQANPAEWTLAVLRPPATTANYHVESSNELFVELLKLLVTTEKVFTVILPRTREQGEDIRSLLDELNSWPACLILEEAIDGLQLAYAADLLISGGGTMNREAALLGVPVYSIFSGKLGSLDAQMEKEGSITFIRDTTDLAKIQLKRRDRRRDAANALTNNVERFVIAQIDRFL